MVAPKSIGVFLLTPKQQTTNNSTYRFCLENYARRNLSTHRDEFICKLFRCVLWKGCQASPRHGSCAVLGASATFWSFAGSRSTARTSSSVVSGGITSPGTPATRDSFKRRGERRGDHPLIPALGMRIDRRLLLVWPKAEEGGEEGGSVPTPYSPTAPGVFQAKKNNSLSQYFLV